jgi:hypothetical protein
MYFCVHEHIVVEDNTFEMNKEDVGNHIEDISFGGIRAGIAGFAEAIADEFACVHAFQS